MPYKIRKQKCRRSDGKSGKYVLSYTDKNRKKHSNCHLSRKRAQAQISAIEAESYSRIKDLIKEMILDIMIGEEEDA